MDTIFTQFVDRSVGDVIYLICRSLMYRCSFCLTFRSFVPRWMEVLPQNVVLFRDASFLAENW